MPNTACTIIGSIILFHDNHVQSLKIEQTVGRGTVTAPRGMWTVVAND